MTVTSTTTQRLVETQTLYDANFNYLQSTSALRTASRRLIADNPKESRPYPDEPVWLHPTNQAEQYDYILNDGVMESPFLPYYSIYRKLRDQALNPAPYIEVFPSSLDWQTKMRLDIKDVSVNLGVSLVEYRETAKMFRNFAVGARDAWRLFKGKKRSRSRLRPCDVAASELTVSYGVEPLVSDLFDSWEILKTRLDGGPLYRRFTSTVRETGSAYRNVTGPTGIDWDMQQRAICYVQLEPNWSSFTLGNPLELAWEVIPFSFVVDWAIPVGDALSALDALKDVKSIVGTVTTKKKYKHSFEHAKVEDQGYTMIVPASCVYSSHQRTTNYSIPLPRVPTWNPSKSWRAIVHGLSLLTTLSAPCQARGSRSFSKR